MKQEENLIKEEDHQFYYQPIMLPFPYVPVMSEIDQCRITIRQLIEENHFLKKQINQPQQIQIRILSVDELTSEIYKMLQYLMSNLNILPKDQIFNYQKQFPPCIQKRQLKQLFFHIFTRYLQVFTINRKASKTKEEMIKFIIRKCIKQSKSKQDWDIQKYEIKKMNATFIGQLFESQTFRPIYQDFLEKYEQIAEEENKIKIQKYVQFLVPLILSDNMQNILSYKRFPWLKEWISQSLYVAQNLNSKKYSKKDKKHLKQTDYLRTKV